jgi:hypothetical protein
MKDKIKKIKCKYCNICKTYLKNIHGSYYGLVDANFSSGYDSTHFIDGFSFTFSLCEKCLYDLFDKFKKSPKIKGYIGGEKLTLKQYRDNEKYIEEYKIKLEEKYKYQLSNSICMDHDCKSDAEFLYVNALKNGKTIIYCKSCVSKWGDAAQHEFIPWVNSKKNRLLL